MNSDSKAAVHGLAIERVSTADQVANAVREKILSGELASGTPLHEVSMSASIGVSRNTLRDAIRILVNEGLLRHNVHRGVTVAELTQADVEDIYAVRRVLEIAGVEASHSEPASKFEVFSTIADDMQKAVDAEDRARIVAIDMLFHRHIVSFLRSKRLDDFFESLVAELRLALVLVDRADRDRARLVAQHRELADLLSKRRTAKCAAQLISHLDESERHLLSVITARQLRNLPSSR